MALLHSAKDQLLSMFDDPFLNVDYHDVARQRHKLASVMTPTTASAAATSAQLGGTTRSSHDNTTKQHQRLESSAPKVRHVSFTECRTLSRRTPSRSAPFTSSRPCRDTIDKNHATHSNHFLRRCFVAFRSAYSRQRVTFHLSRALKAVLYHAQRLVCATLLWLANALAHAGVKLLAALWVSVARAHANLNPTRSRAVSQSSPTFLGDYEQDREQARLKHDLAQYRLSKPSILSQGSLSRITTSASSPTLSQRHSSVLISPLQPSPSSSRPHRRNSISPKSHLGSPRAFRRRAPTTSPIRPPTRLHTDNHTSPRLTSSPPRHRTAQASSKSPSLVITPEQDTAKSMNKMTLQLQQLIRSGQEALGTPVGTDSVFHDPHRASGSTTPDDDDDDDSEWRDTELDSLLSTIPTSQLLLLNQDFETDKSFDYDMSMLDWDDERHNDARSISDYPLDTAMSLRRPSCCHG